ncbi:hypothetical protein [Microbacterium sp. CH12i]|uniref:hypothetical protein n=1 Tax=Microbacterium sp. CH12i TaxID=1479651 RepID=UPI00068ED292|nr:hypothetical protein [Microbacterium sp. CH12i]
MAQHPTLPVILTGHEVLNIAADGESPRETEYGLMLWDKLIADNDQIFLTFNGHFHGASRLTKINTSGTKSTRCLSTIRWRTRVETATSACSSSI